MKKYGKVLLIGSENEENLAIRYLGAELQSKGHSVKIVPCSDYKDFPNVLKQLKSFKPNLVAVSMAFQSKATMFLDLIEKIKEKKPSVHVTVGGHFPTFEYAKILEDENISSVIRFEGETPILKLINALIRNESLQDVPNLVYTSSKSNNSEKDIFLIENPIINEFQNLDQLSFPLRDEKPHIRLGERFGTLVSSRGCFHSHCIYCCIGAFHKMKNGLPFALRTPENVAREMAGLYHKKKVKLFQFHDDNFLLPRKKDSLKRLKSLKKSLVKHGVELDEIAMLIKTRPDGVNREILTIMEEMGCVGVFLGVENASASGLKALARGSTIEEVNTSLELLEDFDMAVTFNLLMFHPRANLNEINQNLYFMNKNIDKAFDFGRAEIVAGSPLEKMVKNRGLLRGNWPKWDYQIEDDAVEKMFRMTTLTFYREDSPYSELSHQLIALSYRANLIQRFYPGKKTKKLKKETISLIKTCNTFTLNSLLQIYGLVAESNIENRINTLAHDMTLFYRDHAKKADRLAGKMWRFQMMEKKFIKKGVGDYLQNSDTLGRLLRI
ncbi:MAG: cobalamin B12-binding domain-containing protein [Methanobacteriaceae archaeon]|nr:cobalamin B12-binding domain-containing protein [Methanobacteriaceae archaeon]